MDVGHVRGDKVFAGFLCRRLANPIPIAMKTTAKTAITPTNISVLGPGGALAARVYTSAIVLPLKSTDRSKVTYPSLEIWKVYDPAVKFLNITSPVPFVVPESVFTPAG